MVIMGGGVSSSSNHPVDNKELKCINPKAAQAQKIYESDGLATTLSALGGGQGGKTGLYKVKKE